MSEIEHKEQVAPEAKAAAAEFLNVFKTFKDDMGARMADMGRRVEAIDRKSADIRRPALSVTAEVSQPHRKAFNAYVRSGDESALRSLEVEGKALNTGTGSEGGFLVDKTTSEQIDSVLRSGASIRALARVVQIEAGSYDVLVDHTDLGAGWATEAGSVSETSGPSIDRISIPLHELSAAPTASQRILDDAAFDIEGWLSERIAEKFLRSESDAFVNGDGVDRPTGFLTYPRVSEVTSSWSWGNIGYIPTGVSGEFSATDPGDVLIETVYSLGAEYRQGAVWVMNSKTAGETRKIKDNQGRFLWLEGLTAAQPPLLAGYPVLIVEDMPDMAGGKHPIAFGNFKRAYTIAERPEMRILRDPYSAKPNVMFYATKRVGGDVTDFAAIKLIRTGI